MRKPLRTSRLPATLLFVLTACASPPPVDSADSVTASAAPDIVCTEDPTLAAFFTDHPGAFVLFDAQTNQTICHNAERAGTEFLPASTFKIASTLIALETGVATGPDFALAWDSTVTPRQPWWPATWARDHTLRTALPASVVWFYQEMARRIGPARMQEYLDAFGYGNRDISGGIDQFWLTVGAGCVSATVLLRRAARVRGERRPREGAARTGGLLGVPAERKDRVGRTR